MKQVFVKRGQITVEDVPVPQCSDNFILVQNKNSLISSGTELSVVKSSKEKISKKAKTKTLASILKKAQKVGPAYTLKEIQGRVEQLGNLGYSSSGIVVQTGKNVKEFSVGDKVACGGAGFATHSEFACVPKNLAVKIPKNVSFEEAAFATVGSIAMHGVRRSQTQIGETVAVIGLGLLGQLTVQILKASGINVIGIDLDKNRVRLSEKFGAKGFEVKKGIEEKINKLTKMGCDSVIISASGKTNSPINLAGKIARKKAKIIVLGHVGLDIDRGISYAKELDIISSRAYGPGRYDQEYELKGTDYPVSYVRWTAQRNMESFLQLVADKKINVKSLTSNIFSLKDVEKAYKNLTDKNSLSVLFKYSEKKLEKKDFTVKISERKKTKSGKINIGLIGPGHFFKVIHSSNIFNIKNFSVESVADVDGKNSKEIAKQFNARTATTDYKNVLENKNVDLVFIATRPDMHTEIAVEALKKGKHVFVEKPVSLNEKEFHKFVKEKNRHSELVCMIGQNKRYAPFSRKIKQFFGSDDKPWMIDYKLNILPQDTKHWVYDSEIGGGRVLSEMIHHYDLFSYFTESKPVQIEAFGAGMLEEKATDDNVVTVLKYENGSVATLRCTNLGAESIVKERMEASKQGKTVQMHDYKILQLYDGFYRKEIRLANQDKGHYQELIDLKNALLGKISIEQNLEDALQATETAFKVRKQIRKLF